MTATEIDARMDKLVEEYKSLYRDNGGSNADFETRRKMMLIASEIGFLIEEKRRIKEEAGD